jgi:2-hydroxychromene-2-carboxylate isomerase
VAEIEERARRYGLPPLRWPDAWPVNGLEAMRCAVWVKRAGSVAAFARAVFRKQFVEGGDISERRLLLDCVEEVGLSAADAERAIELPQVKAALRHATDLAWEAGVRGAPSLRVGDSIFYGDDQLELAALALHRVTR